MSKRNHGPCSPARLVDAASTTSQGEGPADAKLPISSPNEELTSSHQDTSKELRIITRARTMRPHLQGIGSTKPNQLCRVRGCGILRLLTFLRRMRRVDAPLTAEKHPLFRVFPSLLFCPSRPS
ncbi:unnamed protein product [Protopolystoma xenopodis]|uniref:Uncharacterized protein n=1 Tax=Protopolystoma xenopodis TaxID=117903 RepID=A0A3S5BDP9_9PLAT|nr:unnamed protein product [Protopolystoma xenopodis]